MTKRILLIVDESDITFTIKDIQKTIDFKQLHLMTPILALNYYKVHFYDLVILDIKMPKMDDLNYILK